MGSKDEKHESCQSNEERSTVELKSCPVEASRWMRANKYLSMDFCKGRRWPAVMLTEDSEDYVLRPTTVYTISR